MKLKLMTAALALMATTGCGFATGGDAWVFGWIYSGYRSPGQLGTGQPGKIGEACASTILGWIAQGDASIEAARKAGGITQIAWVDHDQFQILGIYGTTCTIVHGQ